MINKKAALMYSLCACMLCSCATEKTVVKVIEQNQSGPKLPPTKTITNFSSALTCMDSLFLEYEKPQVSFLIEDLSDNTGKVSSGTRDMLITALSSMSRRSNVLRVVAYGSDSTNAISLTQQAGIYGVHKNIPKYDIRGSISQYDSNVASNANNVGFSTSFWGFGGDQRIRGDIVGIDLSVVRTQDLSVVNDATSSNQVIVLDKSTSSDADAVIKKNGIYFSFSLDRSDGTVQAVRNLFNLAAIELVGRLMKVPYWNCLGIPHDSEDVVQEVQNWMHGYEQNGQLIPLLSRLLYVKGFYDEHEVDSTLAFQDAVKAYQQSVNAPQTGIVDLSLVHSLLRQSTPASDLSLEEPDGADRLNLPLSQDDSAVEGISSQAVNISIKNSDHDGNQPSEPVTNLRQLEISVDKESYLYCYFKDLNENILGLFPNQFEVDNFLETDAIIRLPGDMPFTIELEPEKGESISCFAVENKITDRLPLNLRNTNFDSLETDSIAAIRNLLIKAARQPIGEAHYSQ